MRLHVVFINNSQCSKRKNTINSTSHLNTKPCLLHTQQSLLLIERLAPACKHAQYVSVIRKLSVRLVLLIFSLLRLQSGMMIHLVMKRTVLGIKQKRSRRSENKSEKNVANVPFARSAIHLQGEKMAKNGPQIDWSVVLSFSNCLRGTGLFSWRR